MKATCTINAKEFIDKFKEIDYAQLTDVFRDAIQRSIDILKNATETELNSIPVNVNGPIRSWGRDYNPLSKGVIAEVSSDATEGRVRIARGSKKGYPAGAEGGSHALKWFEIGTEERFKKGQGYTSKKTKSGNSYRKHRNEGASTGRIKDYNFFKNAYEATHQQMNQVLENNVNRAINTIWNR